MPLPLLFALVVAGIAGIVLLVHLLGGGERPAFADEAEAERAFLADFPERRVAAVLLSDDRRAAVLETDRGAGLVFRIGRGRLTRMLDAPPKTWEEDGALRLDLDFATPALVFACADPARRTRLTTLIAGGAPR